MAIVRRKPRNSSLRFQTFLDSSDITTRTPEKSLVHGLKKAGGRNAYGRITVRHHGGGAYRKYRMIDFKRIHKDVPGVVKTVEYDPNRNVRIGLVNYRNGGKSYMLLPDGIGVGSNVVSSAQAEAKVGNSLPLRNIPVGFMVHNIEIAPGSGAKLARSAGTSAQFAAKTDDGYATLRMPSGEKEWYYLIAGLLSVYWVMQIIKILPGVKQEVRVTEVLDQLFVVWL